MILKLNSTAQDMEFYGFLLSILSFGGIFWKKITVIFPHAIFHHNTDNGYITIDVSLNKWSSLQRLAKLEVH